MADPVDCEEDDAPAGEEVAPELPDAGKTALLLVSRRGDTIRAAELVLLDLLKCLRGAAVVECALDEDALLSPVACSNVAALLRLALLRLDDVVGVEEIGGVGDELIGELDDVDDDDEVSDDSELMLLALLNKADESSEADDDAANPLVECEAGVDPAAAAAAADAVLVAGVAELVEADGGAGVGAFGNCTPSILMPGNDTCSCVQAGTKLPVRQRKR